MVRRWISESGISTVGTAVDAVDLAGIERLIARNGFVDRAVVYVSYDGTLHISISQRKPLVRLLTDGLNAYATAEGWFSPHRAPRRSTCPWSPAPTGRPSRPPIRATCGSGSTNGNGRSTGGLPSSSVRSTLSTAANCRMTAIWQLCGGCGSNAAGGRWRVRPISMPGSRNCVKKRPVCAAFTAIGHGSSNRRSSGSPASRRRSASGKKNWKKATKIS